MLSIKKKPLKNRYVYVEVAFINIICSLFLFCNIYTYTTSKLANLTDIYNKITWKKRTKGVEYLLSSNTQNVQFKMYV